MSECQTKAGNQISLSHSLTLHMLNNFCFHIYAQKSRFIGENVKSWFPAKDRMAPSYTFSLFALSTPFLSKQKAWVNRGNWYFRKRWPFTREIQSLIMKQMQQVPLDLALSIYSSLSSYAQNTMEKTTIQNLHLEKFVQVIDSSLPLLACPHK